MLSPQACWPQLGFLQASKIRQHSHVEASKTLQDPPRRQQKGTPMLGACHFGHLEATMLGQFEARMKMTSGGPKLCCHHRFAGPSLALREGDHTMTRGVGGGGGGGGLFTRRHGTICICIYIYM